MNEGRREDDDMSTIAWPGFVDILSSVIIMFVFFVLITATALYIHTITYKSKILQESKIAIEKIEERKFQELPNSDIELKGMMTLQIQITELNEENQQLKQEIQEVEKTNEELKEKFAAHEEKFKQQGANFSDSESQEIETSDNEMSIIVFYGKDSITLTEDSKNAIMSFFENVSKNIDPTKLELHISSGKNPSAPTESISREIAVARMLNVRNSFINSKLARNAITVNIEPKKQVKGRYDWVKLEFSKK